ncbi:sensor histidine kinase [Emticicia sp. SJ17W-69]|uniref:sensor histidine kinase n=1 Tax=Emticicia sp. SJ17W-69 TaxID=3421657 RepID=UPI003EB88BD3
MNDSRQKLLFGLIFLSISLISNKGLGQTQIEEEKLAYAKLVFSRATADNDTSLLAEAYYLFGKIENAKHNYKKSSEWFYKSLSIIEKKGNSYELGRLYLRLSDNEYKQDHYHNCVQLIRSALPIFQKTKNAERGIMRAYLQIGDAHARAWGLIGSPTFVNIKVDSALFYYRKAESLAIKLGEDEILGLAEVRHSLGRCLSTLNDIRSIDYLKGSLSVYQDNEQQSLKVHCMLDLANAYMAFNQLDKALVLLKESDALINKSFIGDFKTQMHLEEVFSLYYQKKGDWEKAFEYNERKEIYHAKILLADREGAVSRLNIEFDTKKKETQLGQQQLELQLKDENLTIQKRLLWVVGTSLLFTIILSSILFKLFKKNQLISKRNAILIQEQNHRVKNNLQVISSLLNLQANMLEDKEAKQAVDESQLRIEAMAILHRQLYDTDQLDKIDMAVFISELSEIIFQSYGLNDIETDFDITIHEMPADKAIFFGLMLNELISNACKHAFKNHPNPILIINFSEYAEELILKVKDNGFKKTTNLKTHSTSFGLKLINMMTVQLDGTIENKFDHGMEFLIKCKL